MKPFIVLIIAFVASSELADATSCPSRAQCSQYNRIPHAATGGTQAQTAAARAEEHGVNVLEYGAKCDGSTDDRVALQAAIDYAYSSNIGSVYVPPTSSTCKFSPPVFLDAPGNLRGADGTNGHAYNSGTTYAYNATVSSGGYH